MTQIARKPSGRRYKGIRVAVDDDLLRRVQMFADLEGISRNEAWRQLATLALNHIIEGAANR